MSYLVYSPFLEAGEIVLYDEVISPRVQLSPPILRFIFPVQSFIFVYLSRYFFLQHSLVDHCVGCARIYHLFALFFYSLIDRLLLGHQLLDLSYQQPLMFISTFVKWLV